MLLGPLNRRFNGSRTVQTSVDTRPATPRHIQRDSIVQQNRCANRKFCRFQLVTMTLTVINMAE